ncbi:winged helix-turn-helix transcriptional regulator [Myroides odoratimimus]|uniref:winged helix-turn-helix transcriptional regulator n=1 Tax=Myroides odoratimimus TaxID=76832 RepID=UPI002574DD3C|nr:helix-turn-helix domain-containing protein [Myroides odoratimimus]MDM1528072.1 helix-turn-helix transcriptional regulator [Myroides odoratimimus]
MAKSDEKTTKCPAEELLKTLGGKWKVHIIHITEEEPKRFRDYMRLLEGANKQSVSVALKELEEDGFLIKSVIKERPLHIEYSLTERAKLVIPVLDNLYNALQVT